MELSEYTEKQRKLDASEGKFRHFTGNKYKVTGKLKSGKQFKAMVYSNPHQAMGINIWQGSRWVKYPDSEKWYRFSTVFN